MFLIQILSFGHYTIAQRSTVFRFVYWFLVSLLETEFPKFSFTANHLFSYLALLVWNSNCHRINNWNSIVVELTGCSIFPELELGTQCVVEMSGQQTILQHPTTMDKIERWVICWEIFFFNCLARHEKRRIRVKLEITRIYCSFRFTFTRVSDPISGKRCKSCMKLTPYFINLESFRCCSKL